MTKISQLSSIGDSLAIGDQFLIRDIDDTGSPNKSVTVSGITRALDVGTALAPAIAFASDKNTGIYSPGADQLAVSTGGTGRLFVDASGHVGIGTTSPASLLHLRTATGNELQIDPDTGTIVADGVSGITITASRAGGAPITFRNSGTERARIDSSGRLLVGTSTSVGVGARLQTVDDSNANPFELIASPNNEQGPNFNTAKARGSTASPTVVSSGDILGRWRFRGYDGSAYQLGAEITAQVDGTPGANDMPGRLVFSVTADGAASPTEALRISNDRSITVSDGGNVVLGTTTGTKIGTGTTQKIGFYNATPVVQPTAVADATDAASVITQLNALLTRMRNLGLIAT